MSQRSTDHLRTAGKVTVFTTLLGVVVFSVIFLFNIGTTEIKEVDAQNVATTSVTVLNTPPMWTATATEEIESSTDNPTNAGDEISWVAIGTDANGEDYYLLICDGNATPTANSGAAPSCGTGDVQWAVSPAASSSQQARAATTTADSWAESNVWFAWICDGSPGTPRCNSIATQGINATDSSPFEVNHRPSFTVFTDDSPTEPGQVVTFMSTSSDSDTSGAQDTVRLFVCSTNSFDTTTDTCDDVTLASTTAPGVAADASATYTVVIPTQDQDYNAFGFVIDNHGFEASGGAHGTDSTLSVANVAPTVSSSTIVINGGLDMTLTEAASQTPGFTLEFTTDDNNSCDAAGGGLGDEVVDFELSLYRSGVGSTTCTVDGGDYNANNCYPTDVVPTVWTLSCTASTTSCTSNIDTDMEWNCTFPLWYIADPTDGTALTTQFPLQNWVAQVRGIDDDNATGPLSESSSGVDVKSFLAFALNTLSIPYGSLEPGQQTDPLVATTTIAATGNVGLDKDVQGESMCTDYSTGNPCPVSATSTIPESEQRFATDTVSYAAATPLSSTTPQEVEVNVPKSIATSTQATSDAYWGIRVPGSITFSGDYTGENTITAVVGEPEDW